MSGRLATISPEEIVPNPNNPRRYFNEDRLDLLRTSIQEVGVLVPLIVYESPETEGAYVLMDGERRWRSSLDLALVGVPVNVIKAPTDLDNLLQMFNIHNVREDWPLVSVALSLREVMNLGGETGEKRLSEMTGLTRSTVRRAKRLLSIPNSELDLIRSEAHLDRSKQVHREDLYLEIEAAESVLRTGLPEAVEGYSRDEIIRKFAEKAEIGSLSAVTDFRFIPKLVKAANDDVVDRDAILQAALHVVEDPEVSPKQVFEDVASIAYQSLTLQRKADLLGEELSAFASQTDLGDLLRGQLQSLRDLLNQLLEGES